MKAPNVPQDTITKLIKVGVGVALFFVGKKMLANKEEDNADDKIDTDADAGFARALNAAMNPSGFNWMRSFDTTDTTAIYNIAPQIKSLDKVNGYYKAQTQGRVLNEDLISELGADGYDKFVALATHGKSGSVKYSTTRTDIPANLWVVTSADANIRSTPKKESNLLPGNNIVRLVSKGRSVGITTGKYAYDETGDVTFIEFFTLGAKDNIKHFFYVAKSQVELLNKAEKDKREKTAPLPYEVLAGLAGVDNNAQTQITSIRPAIVYDEQLKALTTIPKNIIIGFPLLTLNTGKGIYIKVKTVQGKIRWVNAQDVTVQNRF